MGALSALYTHIQELYPTMLRGNASGWLTSLGFGTAIVMPMIINGLNARYGIEYSLLVIGISFLISAAFVFFLKETQVSNKAESKKIGYN